MYKCPFCGKFAPVVPYGKGYVIVCPDCKKLIYNSSDYPKLPDKPDIVVFNN